MQCIMHVSLFIVLHDTNNYNNNFIYRAGIR